MRAFLIDDHAMVRSGLRYLLQRADIEVVGEAGTIAQAMHDLETAACQVVILDLNLGKEKGTSCARRIREAHPHLPILILTMHDDEALVMEALRCGVNGYIVKSSTDDELVAAVKTVGAGGAYLDPRVADVVLGDLRDRSAESSSLSERERTIIRLLSEGANNKEIAAQLHLSVGAVKGHLSALFARFGVAARSGLVAEAMKRGLL